MQIGKPLSQSAMFGMYDQSLFSGQYKLFLVLAWVVKNVFVKNSDKAIRHKRGPVWQVGTGRLSR